MRSFVALEIPPLLKLEIYQLVEEFRQGQPPAKWVSQRNLHLTLLFLGELGQDSVSEVDAGMRNALVGAKGFELKLSAPGWFRSRRKPGALCIGVDPSVQLSDLRQRVTTGAVGADSVLESELNRNRFQPHLTLARCRAGWNSQALQQWCTAFSQLEGVSLPVQSVVLFQSFLEPAGPRYEEMRRYQLSEGSN